MGRPSEAAQRRGRVLTAALRVFSRAGKHKNDIEEIARRARVGKATLYRDFGSRNGLLVEVAKAGIEDLMGRMVTAVSDAGHAHEQCGAAIREALAFFDDNPELARVLLLEAGESRQPIVAHYLASYTESRRAVDPVFAAHPPSEVMGRHSNEALVDVLSYLITGRLVFWVLTGQKARLTDDAELLIRAYLAGVFGTLE